jgi:hypothetical protein
MLPDTQSKWLVLPEKHQSRNLDVSLWVLDYDGLENIRT